MDGMELTRGACRGGTVQQTLSRTYLQGSNHLRASNERRPNNGVTALPQQCWPGCLSLILSCQTAPIPLPPACHPRTHASHSGIPTAIAAPHTKLGCKGPHLHLQCLLQQLHGADGAAVLRRVGIRCQHVVHGAAAPNHGGQALQQTGVPEG